MNKFLLGTVALSALALTTSAFAADMAPRMYTKAAPVVAPIYNWSGVYAGIHAGYTFGDRTSVDTVGTPGFPVNINNVAIGARSASVGLDRDGFVGGGQIGYNWQSTTPWVWGLEADISYTDVKARRDFVTFNLAGALLNNTLESRLNYFGTVRGRLGYAWDRTLVYATGGLAYGEVENSAAFYAPTTNLLQFAGTTRSTKTGYTVGGGVEHAWMGNWTVKGEYLYYDLGSNDITVAAIPGVGAGSYISSFKNDGHIVRAGLNYKFGGMGF